MNAGGSVERGTLGKFGWVWKILNPPTEIRAHSAPLETKALLQSCSECTERKDDV